MIDRVASWKHGSLWCGRRSGGRGFAAPPRTGWHGRCAAWWRPDAGWWGEALDDLAMSMAVVAVSAADVIVGVGTSAVVYPETVLPQIASWRGTGMVEVKVGWLA